MRTGAQAHGHALRTGRVSEANRAYIVTSVTHERRPLFAELAIGRIVVNAMRYQQSEARATTLAFVVMPDHFHWLMQLGEGTTLSRVVHSVKGFSANAIAAALEWNGRRIWQPGYHDHGVRREEDLAALARYIVANPLRAGLVDAVGDYPLWDTLWLPE
jgi:putative transposase